MHPLLMWPPVAAKAATEYLKVFIWGAKYDWIDSKSIVQLFGTDPDGNSALGILFLLLILFLIFASSYSFLLLLILFASYSYF